MNSWTLDVENGGLLDTRGFLILAKQFEVDVQIHQQIDGVGRLLSACGYERMSKDTTTDIAWITSQSGELLPGEILR